MAFDRKANKNIPKKQKDKLASRNPLQAGISSFLSSPGSKLSSENGDVPNVSDADDTTRLLSELTLQDLPKRYTIYAPLLLLPENFSTHSTAWSRLFKCLGEAERTSLWQCIVSAFNKVGLGGQVGISHVAVLGRIVGELDQTPDGAIADEQHYRHTKMDDTSPEVHGHEVNGQTTSKIDTSELAKQENILRAPINLSPVHGDFGPDRLICESSMPVAEDFDRAFWISTSIQFHEHYDAPVAYSAAANDVKKQRNNSKKMSKPKDIMQTWAPRWTMFSRGNIREKERILNGLAPCPRSGMSSVNAVLGDDILASRRAIEAAPIFAGLSLSELGQPLGEVDVVDLYVGIGYFASCYLARGVKRVWGWDINPWSIEGLRKGCEANGWACLVVRVGGSITCEEDTGNAVVLVDELELDAGVKRLVNKVKQEPERLRCVAFLGNNSYAAVVMEAVLREMVEHCQGELKIRHTNLGLLPSSQLSWDNAVKLLDRRQGGWLHIHENVDVSGIQEKKQYILHNLQKLAETDGRLDWRMSCMHIEEVKMYGPGVVHCVFDVHVSPPTAPT